MFHQSKQARSAAGASPHRFDLTTAKAPTAPPDCAQSGLVMPQATMARAPNSRLARILTGIEGRSFDDLATAAHDRVGQLEGAIRTYVKGQLAAVMAIHQGGQAAMIGRRHELGDLAMNIAEVAGAGKLDAMSEVARGIGAITDSPLTSGVCRTEALGLHISCLSILVRDGDPPTPAHTQAMLRDLKTLRAAIGVVE